VTDAQEDINDMKEYERENKFDKTKRNNQNLNITSAKDFQLRGRVGDIGVPRQLEFFMQRLIKHQRIKDILSLNQI